MTAAVEVPDDARLELKFTAPVREVADARQWLQCHPAGFRKSYDDRVVNNLYFDTHDLGTFDDKLAGISERVKVRLRWYGQTDAPTRGALECKFRRNIYGWKQLFPIEAAPVPCAWPRYLAALRSQLPPNGRLWLDEHPVPVMSNRYLRSYFESADGRLRATIDRELCCFDQRNARQLQHRSGTLLADELVLEIKCHRSERDYASQVLANVPFRVSANSKYALAVAAISSH